MASYDPANPVPQTRVASRPAPAPEITGSVAAPRPAPAGHWSWDGGTPVTVAAGDTVDTLARRYGVPASAIAQSNNIAPHGTIYPGQQLVIPRYVSSTVVASAGPPPRAPMVAAPAPVPAAPAVASRGQPAVHVVARGETLSRISRLYGKSVTELARANRLAPDARLRAGDRLVIPGVRTSKAAPKGKAGPVVAEAKPVAPAAPKEVKAPAEESVSMVKPVADDAAGSPKPAEPAGALPTFRWPARGRVIAGYGPTPNGVQNDGINIALPVGTPVKAAEDGVVAYAGNELKGYGNLVLVRHPNGYVTAYAHAKELNVKRGDHIKRGQVIAKSGQSGNVNAPQLHFEIRKGATPLDPKKYLNGG
jgi:murein DD-endopeptidase MepM/ murein hydrolase activator NlpD